MQRSCVTSLAAVLAIASSLCAPGVGHAQTTYTLTQVDSVPTTTVTGINDEGDLSLTVDSGLTVSANLWRRGIQTNIGGLTPSPQFVEAGGLSDLGQLVGSTISPTSGNFCAYIWSQGHMTELPSPTGATAAFGIQVNLLGQVVGEVYDANSNAHAALWSRGTLTLLPGIPGENISQPVGINIGGEIVGFSEDASFVINTVVWRRGALTLLIGNAIPSAINDVGQIVGTFGASFTPGTPFLWQNGVTTQLPSLPGMAPTGTAEAINDLGQIVGTLTNVAVLWKNGAVIDLNNQIAATDPLQPYVHLQQGWWINNLGQIVATGVDSRNPAIGEWYLLTPVY